MEIIIAVIVVIAFFIILIGIFILLCPGPLVKPGVTRKDKISTLTT